MKRVVEWVNKNPFFGSSETQKFLLHIGGLNMGLELQHFPIYSTLAEPSSNSLQLPCDNETRARSKDLQREGIHIS